MTGREIFLAQLRRLAAPRPAWVPFTGVHAAQLIGVDAQSYLQSAEHIVAGLCAARVAYRPDALPVVFDLQLEAEALGCPVAWAERAPPSVTGHPLSEPGAALPAFDLGAGRIPLVLEATRRMREQCTDQTGLFGLVCGPFTLAMHLMGTGMFLAMYDDPDRVQQVVVHAAAVAARTAEAYLAAGCDAIAVVDPMLSQIAPETAAEFARPHLETVYAEVHAAGAPVALFVCGDATANLDVLCAGACDALSVDENVDLAAAAAVCARHDTALGGNLGLTRPLLTGDPAAC
ncbi:MAG: uroporphyrinogen decarboxylase family protein, partial [Planctomycetota bacterium]